MSEHRLQLDPGIVRRLAGSMETIAEAWAGDIAELRRVEGKLADTERDLNAATDRANSLQTDLRNARAEISDLTKRNAHLEAQIQSLYDKSMDAQDALGGLAARAVDVARAMPAAATKPAWKDPEKNPPGDEDSPPAFMRDLATAARLPANNFPSHRESN